MARPFSLVAFLVVFAVGCATVPPAPSAVIVAPIPKAYTCDQQGELARAYRALPLGSILRTAINDYGEERDKLRAVHGMPQPKPCP